MKQALSKSTSDKDYYTKNNNLEHIYKYQPQQKKRLVQKRGRQLYLKL